MCTQNFAETEATPIVVLYRGISQSLHLEMHGELMNPASDGWEWADSALCTYPIHFRGQSA
jgi:hypothetical protein